MSFTVTGSLISAAAKNSTIFIVGRAIGGVGCAGVFSGALTIIAYTVPLHRRPRFTGGITTLFSVNTPIVRSFADSKITGFVGPVLGGVFTDKATWRWCFYINLPLSAITIGGIFITLQSSHLPTNKTIRERLKEFDYLGPIFFIPANICLLLALQWGVSRYPWNSPIILSLFSAFVLILPIWIYSQYRLGERATIPLHIMRQRTVFYASMYGFFAGASLMIPMFYIPLYFQAIQSKDATASAIDTLPFIIGVTTSSLGNTFFLPMIGYFMPCMIIGAGVLAVGTGLLSTLSVNTSLSQWLGYQVISGLGAGFNLQVLNGKKHN